MAVTVVQDRAAEMATVEAAETRQNAEEAALSEQEGAVRVTAEGEDAMIDVRPREGHEARVSSWEQSRLKAEEHQGACGQLRSRTADMLVRLSEQVLNPDPDPCSLPLTVALCGAHGFGCRSRRGMVGCTRPLP